MTVTAWYLSNWSLQLPLATGPMLMSARLAPALAEQEAWTGRRPLRVHPAGPSVHLPCEPCKDFRAATEAVGVLGQCQVLAWSQWPEPRLCAASVLAWLTQATCRMYVGWTATQAIEPCRGSAVGEELGLEQGGDCSSQSGPNLRSAWPLTNPWFYSFDDIDLPSAVKYLMASDPNLQVLGAAYIQHRCYSDAAAKKQVTNPTDHPLLSLDDCLTGPDAPVTILTSL